MKFKYKKLQVELKQKLKLREKFTSKLTEIPHSKNNVISSRHPTIDCRRCVDSSKIFRRYLVPDLVSLILTNRTRE